MTSYGACVNLIDALPLIFCVIFIMNIGRRPVFIPKSVSSPNVGYKKKIMYRWQRWAIYCICRFWLFSCNVRQIFMCRV